MHTQLLHIVHFLGVQALADINSCDVPVIFRAYRFAFCTKIISVTSVHGSCRRDECG